MRSNCFLQEVQLKENLDKKSTLLDPIHNSAAEHLPDMGGFHF